jgi:ribonuclease-3
MGDAKKKINTKDEKILSDACEALVGAVFIDSGYLLAKKFVLDIWKEHIKQSRVTILDSKTKLQEYSLKLYKKLPIYKLISHKGPRHSPIFKISVKLDKTKSFIGFGNSKKNAEQDAANKLLKSINIF